MFILDKNFMDVAMVQMSIRESVIASNAWNVCFVIQAKSLVYNFPDDLLQP